MAQSAEVRVGALILLVAAVDRSVSIGILYWSHIRNKFCNWRARCLECYASVHRNSLGTYFPDPRYWDKYLSLSKWHKTDIYRVRTGPWAPWETRLSL